MIDRSHDLPLTRQAEVLQPSRSRLYSHARPVSAADLAIMRRIDELHLDHPFPEAGCCAIFFAARASRSVGPRHNDDAADGDRGDLPATEHLQAGGGCPARC